MWLIVFLIALLISSALYFTLKSQRKKFRLGFLTLMLLGSTIMIFVDKFINYLKEGVLLKYQTEGLIQNPILLGITMLLPILLIWLIAVFIKKDSNK